MNIYCKLPSDVQGIIDGMMKDNGDKVIDELKFYAITCKFNKCVAQIIRYWNGL